MLVWDSYGHPLSREKPEIDKSKEILIDSPSLRLGIAPLMKPLKICYLLESTNLSGGVRVVFDQTRVLRERGHEVKVRALFGDHMWYPYSVDVDYVSDLLRRLIFVQALIRIQANNSIVTESGVLNRPSGIICFPETE